MAYLDRDLILKKASQVEALICDVDGVMTDGSITYSEESIEIKTFSVLDGLGIKLLMDAGVEFCILSSRSSKATQKRALELGISQIYQGIGDKLTAYERIKASLGLEDGRVAYMGDDLVDLPILTRVGLSITVPNCAHPLRDYCHYCTTAPGGKGAVREVAEIILRAKNIWSQILNRFIHPSTNG